jgi:hypothetical protein
MLLSSLFLMIRTQAFHSTDFALDNRVKMFELHEKNCHKSTSFVPFQIVDRFGKSRYIVLVCI